MLHQIKLMLLNFGIIATLHNKPVEGKMYYRLWLNGLELQKYVESIGFVSAERNESVKRCDFSRCGNSNIDVIPNLSGLLRSLHDAVWNSDRQLCYLIKDYTYGRACPSYEKLGEIVHAIKDRVPSSMQAIIAYLRNLLDRRYFFDPVDTIEDDQAPVFDVEMPETHSFWANGFASHNSSLAYRLCGAAQRMNLGVVWIDTENSFSEALAKINGMDPKHKYCVYANMSDHKKRKTTDPSKIRLFAAEDVLDNVYRAIVAGAGVIVIDSVANLVPRCVLEGTADQQQVAKLARLMSAQMGKIVQAAADKQAIVVWINQKRVQPGVMFGCFHHNSRIVLADGSTEEIGKIVNQKMPVEVLSYNAARGKVEAKKVVDWHINGALNDDEHFMQFEVRKPYGNELSQFACTPNHIIFRSLGSGNYEEVSADSLSVGDKVVSLRTTRLNEDHAFVVDESEIISISNKSKDNQNEKFDITVEGNSNYFVDGVLVHNSPETTTGGKALGFSASLRLEIHKATKKVKRGSKSSDSGIYIEDDHGRSLLIGRWTRVSIVKNKFAPPTAHSDFVYVPIYYRPYFPTRESLVVDFSKQVKITKINKQGNYIWGKQKFSTKKEFVDALKQNTDLLMKLVDESTSAAEEQDTLTPPEFTNLCAERKYKILVSPKDKAVDPNIELTEEDEFDIIKEGDDEEQSANDEAIINSDDNLSEIEDMEESKDEGSSQ
jgi:RecA/RadA recombinase